MSQFKIFQVDKKAKFLGKAKSHKAKREEETKRNQSILIVQKNVRSFLMAMRHGGSQFPLLIRKTQQIAFHYQYIQSLWNHSQQIPSLLKRRITILTIQALMQHKISNLNIKKVMLAIAQQKQMSRQIKCKHFIFIIQQYFDLICNQNILASMIKILDFKQAFELLMKQKITRLVQIIQRTKEDNLTTLMIQSYYKSSKNWKKDQYQQQSLEQLRYSFLKTAQLLFQSIRSKKNQDHLLYLLSIVLQKLRNKYIQVIVHKYKINQSLIRSVQFREEVNELLEQKDQWTEYQQLLLPLTQLLPHFLSKFSKFIFFSIEYILKIVVEITKLNQSFGAIKLENEEFFLLIEKLQSKGLLNRQQFEFKQYELLFTVIILQKYLESINDMQFVNQFRFEKQKLSRTIKTFVIKFMKDMCSLSGQSQVTHQILNHSQLLLSNLYNKLFRTNLLPTTIFEDNSLAVFLATNKINSNTKFYMEMIKILERSPFLLPIDTRFMMFKNMVRQDRNSEYHYQNVQLKVRRYHQFQDAFNALFQRSLKSRMRVVFINEHGIQQQGIDGGGLTKELLTRVFKKAFDPKFGLFVQNQKKELMPNPEYQGLKEKQKIADMYEFVGQLLGKSLYQNIMLGVKFAGPFLNLLINKKNTFDDLLTIDPELYKSVAYIMGMQQGIQQLQLTFLYQDHMNNKYINLLPQGNSLKVTAQNKMQYLNLLINYKVNHSFQKQTRFIRKGLRLMIKEKWLEIFNYAELNYLISGSGVIDVADWKAHAIYVGHRQPKYIDTFWQIVTQFTQDEKSLLLKFVTSCERPSFLGFKDLSPPFCIHLLQKESSLPTSHTCSNVLDLPIYDSKEVLKEKLLYAIKAGAGFEFG